MSVGLQGVFDLCYCRARFVDALAVSEWKQHQERSAERKRQALMPAPGLLRRLKMQATDGWVKLENGSGTEDSFLIGGGGTN